MFTDRLFFSIMGPLFFASTVFSSTLQPALSVSFVNPEAEEATVCVEMLGQAHWFELAEWSALLQDRADDYYQQERHMILGAAQTFVMTSLASMDQNSLYQAQDLSKAGEWAGRALSLHSILNDQVRPLMRARLLAEHLNLVLTGARPPSRWQQEYTEELSYTSSAGSSAKEIVVFYAPEDDARIAVALERLGFSWQNTHHYQPHCPLTPGAPEVRIQWTEFSPAEESTRENLR